MVIIKADKNEEDKIIKLDIKILQRYKQKKITFFIHKNKI